MNIRDRYGRPYPGGMSKSPQQSQHTPPPRDDSAEDGAAAPGAAEDRPGPGATPAPSLAALVFDDPMSLQSSDDTDRGWGEGSSGKGAGSSAADLARFLDEKPPHHI